MYALSIVIRATGLKLQVCVMQHCKVVMISIKLSNSDCEGLVLGQSHPYSLNRIFIVHSLVPRFPPAVLNHNFARTKGRQPGNEATMKIQLSELGMARPKGYKAPIPNSHFYPCFSCM